MANDPNSPEIYEKPNSGWEIHALVGLVAGLAFYIVIAVILLKRVLGKMLADGGAIPWSCRVMSDPINAITFAAFGVAIAILAYRRKKLRGEQKIFGTAFMDESEDRVLIPEDARELRKKVVKLSSQDRGTILIRLLVTGLKRSKSSWNATDVADAINNQSDIVASELESDYAMIRYLAWAIPSIGFIGTVLGIGKAMGTIGGSSSDSAVEGAGSGIAEAAGHLNTAFDTTFVSLGLSLILMYFVYTIQAKEERMISTAVDWCMQKFVNRMHIGPEA